MIFFEDGYAVLIGVGGDLPITIKDASIVNQVLTDSNRCGYPKKQVKLLVGEEANKDSIIDALNWLIDNVQETSTVLFYFSGHGIESPGYYILPNGYDLNKVEQTCISEAVLSEMFSKIKAKKVVTIFDCCHAGGQLSLENIKSPISKSLLDKLGEGTGRVVLASSRKDEVSYTGNVYSEFTTALVEGLGGYAASEKDGYSKILDIYSWITRKVPDRTGDKQHPIIKVKDLSNNFPLCLYSGGEKKVVPFDFTMGKVTEIDISTAVSHKKEGLKRRLNNHRQNLFLIEERMSEYIEYTNIPLQLVKNRQWHMESIEKIEKELAEN